MTKCNSCGEDPAESEDAADSYKEKYAKCMEQYADLFDSPDSIPKDNGNIVCPIMVNHNLQSVGQRFYGDDFCKDNKDCSVKDVQEMHEKVNGELESDEFNIYETIGGLCIIFAIIATCTVIAGYFQVMMYTKVATYQVHLLRQMFFKSIMGQEIGWFDVNAAGTLNSMLADDVTKVSDGMGDKFAILLQKVACFIFGIIFSLIQDLFENIQ